MANDARFAQLQWLNSLVNAVISILLLATVAVYARGSAIRIFARFVHSWPRLRANPVLVTLETVVLIFVLGYGSWPWTQAMSQPPANPAIPPPLSREIVTPEVQLMATAAIAIVGATTAMIVLRLRERQIITDKATDRM